LGDCCEYTNEQRRIVRPLREQSGRPEGQLSRLVGAPPQALSLFARRVKRRCQAAVESDVFFKATVIGSGFLSTVLAMMALLSTA